MRLAPVVLGMAVACGVAAGAADGFAMTDAADPSYLALQASPEIREEPDAQIRLVGIVGGVPVIDRGLRNSSSRTRETVAGKTVEVENGTRESAWIAEDRAVAVVATRRYRIERVLDDRGRPPEIDPPPTEVSSSVVWLDVGAPRGRWTAETLAGWEVVAVELLRGGRGVVVMLADLAEDAELRVYDPNGAVVGSADGLLASSFDVRQSASGTFVAADVAFRRTAPGLPARAILVADLLRGAAWRYAWEYGSDLEPSAWRLEDDGTMVVRNGFGETRYDRTGAPTSTPRKPRSAR